MQTIVPTRGLPSIAAGLSKSPCGKVSFKFKRLHSVVSDAVYSWSRGRVGRVGPFAIGGLHILVN